MNHIEFIEKNVREELLRQGFTQAVAQGGAYQAVDMYKRMSQASRKGGCLTMLCDTQSYGQRNKPAQLNVVKLSAQCEREVIRQGCSERVKTVVLEHSRSSSESIWAIHGIKYVKYR